ncbi:hypothetical protein [His 1 virus]|uniref:Uncharacterized protein ORF22 n=1 Tax=His1 virus (isolate Australia/Victoria) TaxID=654912 RepID=Y022_HIS1I|nr:hypothetical protein His1V_gp22 [His 1 virus]Q25BH3.1 RecName: Full=Uncharacterized protein ORF22 [His1 virus (isolate Victoria)]AAQ13737.1 hypothetical protein [His 1 virus]
MAVTIAVDFCACVCNIDLWLPKAMVFKLALAW